MGKFRSAYASLYKTARKVLKVLGVPVNETSNYPRIELHSFVENGAMDKGDSVRQVTLTVEAMSSKSASEAVSLIEGSLERVVAENLGLAKDGFRVFGVEQVQLQDITENSDSQQIIYRMLQTLTVFIETI